MRSHLSASVCLSALLLPALSLHAQQAGAQRTAPLSTEADRPVIVVMKNRLSGEQAASDQMPVMSELHQTGATRIKPFRLVNAFAATVSEGEMDRLMANPTVAAVVPDVMIRRTRRAQPSASGTPSADSPGMPKPTFIPGSCRADGQVQLNPEALLTTNTDSDNPKAKTARSLGMTGAGVKVAWIADGIDIRNPNFIRPNGSPVFVDYQDFSGFGPGAPTGGEEAFEDASSIAAQGDVVYNISHYSVQPLPSPCNIRIEGVAPGASLVGLNAFGSADSVANSVILQAIDYAVTVAHVDVLNESFGGNEIPDSGSMDATRLFDDAAVAAGVTVTVSSGDAGVTSTIGSPSTDPLVIGVGATTTYRVDAQTNNGGARDFATTGWLNDNISPLSSGGFEQSARTVDLVAPGDLNWGSCDASPQFANCTNLRGAPSRFIDIGGTSESAPLTAGAAALVIEAYRNFHDGASPSPALVKQILTSTANDLGLPATEQGSGILNTYKAVLLAESIKTGDGRPAPTGQTLLVSQDQLTAIDKPGTPHSWPVKVTNTGAASQTVTLTGRRFGPDQNVQSGSVVLSDGTNPQFINFVGAVENYAKISFHVPASADRLTAAIAYPPALSPNRVAYLTLIDPHGKLASYSLPQGIAHYASVDVRKPAKGNWTGIIWSRSKATGGVMGTIPWRVTTQNFMPFASVSPPSLTLAPGESETVRVSATTPSTPGDTSGSIVVSSSAAGVDPYLGEEKGSISVDLRSLVDLAGGGAFSGVLTGGNGRSSGVGQVAYYAFHVGPNASSITANVSLTNDFGDTVGSYLVNPDGVAVGFGQNSINGISTPSLTANTINPVPGVWTLIVNLAQPVVGDEISQTFTGNIVLNQGSATASSLPNDASTTLAAGVPVSVPVTITNRGTAPEAVFIDARLDSPTTLTLASIAPPPTSAGYPLPISQVQPLWLMPTETSSVRVRADATVPVVFDYGPVQGDPDLYGAPTAADKASATYTPGGGTVQPGIWFAFPDEIGPFSGPAPAGTVKVSLQATTKPFDRAVTSPTGDFWLESVNPAAGFAPVTLNPGQSVTLDVRIKPTGVPGTIVSGALYVDNFISNVPPGQTTGNEVTSLPYTYTVGAPASALAGK